MVPHAFYRRGLPMRRGAVWCGVVLGYICYVVIGFFPPVSPYPPPPIPSPQTDSRVKDGQLVGAENTRMLMAAAAGVVVGLLLAKVLGLRG